MELTQNVSISYSSDRLDFSFFSIDKVLFQKSLTFKELLNISPLFAFYSNLHTIYTKIYSKVLKKQYIINKVNDSLVDFILVFTIDEDQVKINISLQSETLTPPSQDSFIIKHASIQDTPIILSLIKELAEYQKLAHTVKNNEENIKKVIFGEGEEKRAESLIGYYNNKPVASLVYFCNYSTFTGRPGIYIEDIYVKPEYRKHGFGKKMMSYVSKICVKNNYALIQWSVLDWNETAIKFYKSLGAEPVEGWTSFTLTDQALINLADNTDQL